MEELEKLAASFSRGHAAYNHDIRKTLKKNVNPELSKDNIILEDNRQGRTIESIINEKMQPYIDEYNAKQKRKDRTIQGKYTEWHRDNKTLKKTNLEYEFVMQIGEHETTGKQYYESQGQERETLKQNFINIYADALQTFKEKYPHLEINYAVIHFDEEAGTPHMHLNITPIGEFEKQGLKKKVSIGRALECDGIERVKDRKEAQKEGGYQLTKLYNNIQKWMEQKYILNRGYGVKEHQHGKEHLTREEWEAKKELTAEIAQAKEQTEKAKQEAKAYTTYTEELKKIDEIMQRPEYSYKDVERVTVGSFKNKKEVIQMSPDTFDALRSGGDMKHMEFIVNQKIERQQIAAEKLQNNLITEKEQQQEQQIQALKIENNQLKQQVKEKDNKIQELKDKLTALKEFLMQLNIIERYKDWYLKRLERKKQQEQNNTIKRDDEE